MKHRSLSGYTVVEVLIVLAVSGMLFISAAYMVAGQQSRADFSQAVRDFENQLNDISNDVATGYYADTNNFRCSAGTAAADVPTITSAVNSEQGTNTGCIYLGRVVQFAPSEDASATRIYTVVGKQRTTSGTTVTEVTTISDSKPVAIAPGAASLSGIPDATELQQINGNAEIKWARANNGAGDVPISSLAILTSFGKYDSDNKLQSGSLQVDRYYLGSAINQTMQDTADTIHNSAAWATNKNPSGAITVCLEGGSNQYAIVSIGGRDQQQFATSVIGTGECGP